MLEEIKPVALTTGFIRGQETRPTAYVAIRSLAGPLLKVNRMRSFPAHSLIYVPRRDDKYVRSVQGY